MIQDLLNTLYNKFNGVTFDSYLLENHERLNSLFSFVHSFLGADIKIPFHRSFSSKDILELEQKFLYTLNASYQDKFRDDLVHKNIIQKKDIFGYYYRNFDLSEYKIYIPKNLNIIDFVTLSHEYTHHLSSGFPRLKEDSSAYTVYCEMIAVLAELKSLDFLQKQNISFYEINAYTQYIKTKFLDIYSVFSLLEPLLDLYLSKEQFIEEDVFQLFHTVSFYRFLGIENMIGNLKRLLQEDLNCAFLSYRYLLGMIWAAFLHQNSISNDEFVLLIDHINDLDVEDFENLLPQKSPIELATSIKKEFCYKRY